MTKPVRASSLEAEPWVLCLNRRSPAYRRRLECGHRGRLSAAQRLARLLDPGSAQTIDGHAVTTTSDFLAEVPAHPDLHKDEHGTDRARECSPAETFHSPTVTEGTTEQ